MSEVEIEQALIALCHLHAELLLRQPIQPLIGKNGVLILASLTEQLAYGWKAAKLCPILKDIGRMVDVVEVQECLVSELAESLEVIVLVFYPVGVHLP